MLGAYQLKGQEMFRYVIVGSCVAISWVLNTAVFAGGPIQDASAFNLSPVPPVTMRSSRDEAGRVFQLADTRSTLIGSAPFVPSIAVTPSAGSSTYSPLMGIRPDFGSGLSAAPPTQLSLPYDSTNSSFSTHSVLNSIHAMPVTSFDQRVNSLVPDSGRRGNGMSGFQPMSPLYQVR
jgi:hypothetical protein